MRAFKNRDEAGHRLAEALSGLDLSNPLILAIPRGAVPMGEILSRELGGELDVVLVRKIGAPENPEFAIGAVDENGDLLLSREAALFGIGREEAEFSRKRELSVIRERRRLWGEGCPPVDPSGRTVIVVDDGIATGATMEAALRFLRKRKPERLIAAVPVAPPGTLDRIRPLADRVICLLTPENFQAVSQFYDEFPQVSDEEVREVLARRGAGDHSPG